MTRETRNCPFSGAANPDLYQMFQNLLIKNIYVMVKITLNNDISTDLLYILKPGSSFELEMCLYKTC